MYSGTNVTIIPRNLVYPFAGRVVNFIDIPLSTANKLVSIVQGINTSLQLEHKISMNVLNRKKLKFINVELFHSCICY
jgi:hypothetical protein